MKNTGKRLGVVMDPIASIHYHKDTTFSMLLEAEKRGFTLYYFELKDLFLSDGEPYGNARLLHVFQDEKKWFELAKPKIMPLGDLSILLMRKDPPFNESYYYSTYILERAENKGVKVINRPSALRNNNEKLLATLFPDCVPPILVTQSKHLLQEFCKAHDEIVCKPLGGMGGIDIFRLKKNDPNANVIFDVLTQHEQQYIMAQLFIPAITEGDKRIIIVNGEVIPYALSRVPQGNDWRGNLAVGAKGVVQPLSLRDAWIANRVSGYLKEQGLYFVGLDIIGDYLTEINVTSPTGIREIERETGINISGQLFDAVAAL